MRIAKLLLIPFVAMLQGATMVDSVLAKDDTTSDLNHYLRSEVPGLQYIAVTADRVLFEYAGGWADIQGQKAMTLDTTLMAYSMTKTFTAVAILQLAEQRKLSLDHLIDGYLPNAAYHGHGVTLRQLLNHTSGVPNPIPLRWVHLAAEDSSFNEAEALAAVLRENPDLAFEPGRKFAYSNIGYWLLGKVVEQVTGQSYPAYMRANVLQPLRLSAQEMDFVIPDESRHANGYLKKYSLMNLVKGFVIDRKFLGGYEGHWLRFNSHYLNGPAFGGLIGTARGFSRFLQDQLRTESVLFGLETKRLLETRHTDGAGRPIPMTPGWHVGETRGVAYFFKEGGGGGFHCEMRIYPAKGVATVVMANSTGFNSTGFLNHVDRTFLEPRR
ncbi:serine hydrolase domain-containing protein [Rhodoferax sp.]|uniref:serine hydrolase domain-containing protein n=1 Tax=Rhodoferax sp. TaxID=50421 RepID=UPI0027477BA8|nr:serine hydrolase domain-containing protein [Rhodoferax sp.]